MSEQAQYYRAHLFFCTNKRPPDHPRGDCACGNSEPMVQYLKARIKEDGLKRIRVNTAGCLHRCRHAPVLVIYPEGAWYTFSSSADLDEILETHLKGGRRVERLALPDRAPEGSGQEHH